MSQNRDPIYAKPPIRQESSGGSPAERKDEIEELKFVDVPSSLANGKLVLNEALRKNDMALFSQYLHHLDAEAVNRVDFLGATALHLATLFGKQDAVQALLAKGAKVDIGSSIGLLEGTLKSITAVDLAVHCGEVEILEKYLLPSLKNMEESKKQELLEQAGAVRQTLQTELQTIQTKKQKLEKFMRLYFDFETTDDPDALLGKMASLVKQGGMIDFIKSRRGPNVLHRAAGASSLKTMKALILLGGDVDKGVEDKEFWRSYSSEGNRPLHLACSSSNVEAVKLLLKAGADASEVNDKGENALHFLMKELRLEEWISPEKSKERFDVMDLLLEAGVALDKRNDYGWTPLVFACLYHQWKMAKKLIDAGADVQSLDNDYRSVLHLTAPRINGLDVFKLILEKTENVDRPDSKGATPLALAIEANNLDAIRLLIKNGADIGKVGSDGETALHKAALEGDQATIDYLLDIPELHAKIDQPNKEGKTALQCAFVHNDAKDERYRYWGNRQTTNTITFSALLEKGADIDAPYQEGETMLYHGRIQFQSATAFKSIVVVS